MPARRLKLLCVADPAEAPDEAGWREALACAFGPDLDIVFCALDPAFRGQRLPAKAMAPLLAGSARAMPREALSALDGRRSGLLAAWAEHPALRRKARSLLLAALAEHGPQRVVAHGLGSLVAYDALSSAEKGHAVELLLLGTPLAHPALRSVFGGRLRVPQRVSRLVQLHNPRDLAFAEALPLREPGFSRVDTAFADDAPLQHAAPAYLRRASWPAPVRSSAASRRPPRRRALLVGLNDYADPGTSPLKGCVNDAWLMSALLQESGFAADEVRMVLNERATAAALQERLDWLVDGARPGDHCVLYFSGHGAQLPVYGSDGQQVVAVHESLVPYDFDWSRGHAFSDQQFAAFYAQLPYELNFLAIFDCCHSGGLTRGGSQRVRGLNPPDDVRHRMLRWDAQREMWLPRRFDTPAAEFARRYGEKRDADSVQPTHRLGLAQPLRASGFKRLAADYGHKGPFMPTLLHACGETEFAHEYEHGPISHGAFSYGLVKRLRAARREGRALSFAQLVAGVRQELQQLGYAQTPQLAAPRHIRNLPVPLRAA